MTAPDQNASVAGEHAAAPGVLRRLTSADFIISAFLLVLFVAAFLGAQDWPFRSRLFPVMVAVAGAGFALLKMVLTLLPPRSAPESERRHVLGGVELTDDEDEEDQALEYVFERASRAEWARVLAWVTGFFLGLLLVGAVVVILSFTVLYLLVEARTSLLVAVIYAAVLGGMLYAAQSLLNISLPPGILMP